MRSHTISKKPRRVVTDEYPTLNENRQNARDLSKCIFLNDRGKNILILDSFLPVP